MPIDCVALTLNVVDADWFSVAFPKAVALPALSVPPVRAMTVPLAVAPAADLVWAVRGYRTSTTTVRARRRRNPVQQTGDAPWHRYRMTRT